MARVSYRLTLVGGKELLTKLNANNLLAGPWRETMEKVGQIAETAVKRRSPLLTGRLEASITHKVDAAPIPAWAMVTASAENKGFRYGFALDAGKARRKSGTQYTFHYASFRTSTKGWFSGARKVISAQIAPIINAAAKAVEQKWRQ